MTLTIDIAAFFKGTVLLLFVIVSVSIVALLAARIRRYFASREFSGRDLEQMRKRWGEIEEMVESSGEMSRKLAIVECDKLLDEALKSLAMPGDTLGERLKFAAYKYPDLQEVWGAHRVRNQLVHEATFHLDAGIARKAVKTYRRALQRLGAI